MTHVLLVSGAWLAPVAWRPLVERLAAAGVASTAPAWPHLSGPPAALREHVPEALGGVGVRELRAHHEAALRGLGLPPEELVLVGHSTGGLVAQQLLAHGLARSAVALAPLPPRGVLPRPVEVVSTAPLLARPWAARGASALSRRAFVRRFTAGLSAKDADRLYDEQVVPAPHRVVWQAATSPLHGATQVAAADGRPLLVLIGQRDRMVAPSGARAAVRRLQRLGGVVQVEQVAEGGHHLLVGPATDDVVRRVAHWIAESRSG